jgi:hypothetical protein
MWYSQKCRFCSQVQKLQSAPDYKGVGCGTHRFAGAADITTGAGEHPLLRQVFRSQFLHNRRVARSLVQTRLAVDNPYSYGFVSPLPCSSPIQGQCGCTQGFGNRDYGSEGEWNLLQVNCWINCISYLTSSNEVSVSTIESQFTISAKVSDTGFNVFSKPSWS